jgi:hypothetical protein
MNFWLLGTVLFRRGANRLFIRGLIFGAGAKGIRARRVLISLIGCRSLGVPADEDGDDESALDQDDYQSDGPPCLGTEGTGKFDVWELVSNVVKHGLSWTVRVRVTGSIGGHLGGSSDSFFTGDDALRSDPTSDTERVKGRN